MQHLMTRNMVKSVENFIKKTKRLNVEKEVGKGMTRTIGGVHAFIEKRLRANIPDESFTTHTCYVFGEPVVAAAADGEGVEILRVCMSTENLLLNAYRQAVSGMQRLICVDTTHRLTKEGYPVFPLGTVDIGQHFHVIAYMIASNERSVDFAWFMQQTKAEVERVVNIYAHNCWQP